MAGIVIALLAAVTIGAGQDAAVTFRTLARGADSRIDARRELIARTPGIWHLIWYKHCGKEDPPSIDLTREMVVAVFAGKRPTTGHSVQVVNVTREEGTIVVHYREQIAEAISAAATPATPFHIIAVPSAGLPVRFVEDR